MRTTLDDLLGDLAAEFAPDAPVVLVGSHARGTATAESDVDLIAIGEGPDYRLARRSGQLVAVSWRSEGNQYERFADPETAVAEVPAWRSAVIIQDRDGIATRLKSAASEWTWDVIAEAAQAWVADGITNLAEEVQKLASAMIRGRDTVAAVQRSLLALHLPMVMAVHFRRVYESENDVWDIVAGADARWAGLQRIALGTDSPSFVDGCTAALRLYALAAELADATFTGEQRSVIVGALSLADTAIRRMVADSSAEPARSRRWAGPNGSD